MRLHIQRYIGGPLALAEQRKSQGDISQQNCIRLQKKDLPVLHTRVCVCISAPSLAKPGRSSPIRVSNLPIAQPLLTLDIGKPVRPEPGFLTHLQATSWQRFNTTERWKGIGHFFFFVLKYILYKKVQYHILRRHHIYIFKTASELYYFLFLDFTFKIPPLCLSTPSSFF